MTVLQRMIAAGFDPDAAERTWGDGSLECNEIEVRMNRCKPDGFTDSIMVRGCGCHPYTDGSVRPAPSWYGDEVVMIFATEKALFEFRQNPYRV